MKFKVNIILTVVILLCCSINVFAQPIISELAVTPNADNGKVTVTGNIMNSKLSQVSLMIIKNSTFDALSDIDATNIKDKVERIVHIPIVNNQFSYSFYIDKQTSVGWYKAVIGAFELKDGDVARQVDFFIPSVVLVNSCITDINGAGNSSIMSVLEKYSVTNKILILKEFDPTRAELGNYFNEIKETEYSNNIIDTQQIVTVYNKALLLYKFNNFAVNSFEPLIEEASSLFSLQYVTEYENNKTATINILHNNIHNTTELSTTKLKELFSEAVVVAYINKTSLSDMGEAVGKYNAILKLDLTDKFTKVNALEAYKSIVNGNFVTVSQIKTAFDIRVLELYNALPKSDNGGGGGGGGGTISIPKPIIVTPKPLPEEKADGVISEFDDISDVEWASEAIIALKKSNVINGVGERIFAPYNFAQREEFAKMLVGAFDLLEKDAKCDFTDVKVNEWYYPYVASATTRGIVLGADGVFGIGRAITRQDIATIIYRTLGKPKMDAQKISFADNALISDYAKDAVGFLCANGVLNGYPDNTFAPLNNATRAEIATIIYKSLKVKGVRQ